jgi:uncharacterized protein
LALKKTSDHSIPYTGLKLGIHEFEFKLSEKFFEGFEYSEISGSEILVKVILDKKNTMIILDFIIGGKAETLCDRCQEKLEIELDHEDRVFVKFGEQTSATDGEILVLGPQEFEIELSQFLYEFSHLAMPAKRVHSTMNACNEDIIQILDEMADFEEEKETDSRWDALKRLTDSE